MHILKKFLKNTNGATAIEYGLIAMLISIVCVAALETLGSSYGQVYTTLSTAVTDAVG